MPQHLTSYRVFLASPGGLQRERKGFRDVFQEYNESEAFDRGLHFRPIGWEITLGGAGRPQKLINEEIRTCDFFVLLLHDRWGSSPFPTGVSPDFTSGTEEEFHFAMSCLNDAASPMRDVVLFFKGLPAEQMSDPGDQLAKVLEFRTQIEGDKTHLYETFDTLEEFKMRLRRHLARWARQGRTKSES